MSTDLLGVALASVALLAWSRRHVPAAGVLLGLAVATRSYALVLLLAIGLLALRSGRLRSFATLAVTALATVLVVTLPWLLSGDGVLAAYRAWWSAAASYGSPWMVPALYGHPLPGVLVTTLAVLGWVAALVAGAVLALSPGRRPTVAEVALVMLATVLVTGAALPPQASLWLLPLIALVGLRWRDHLIWAGVEAASLRGGVALHRRADHAGPWAAGADLRRVRPRPGRRDPLPGGPGLAGRGQAWPGRGRRARRPDAWRPRPRPGAGWTDPARPRQRWGCGRRFQRDARLPVSS